MPWLFAVGLSVVFLSSGCASQEGDSSPSDNDRAPVVTLRASTTYDPLDESCEDNSTLLDILAADAVGMFCTGATPEEVVDNVTGPCSQHPRATCAPELGFRCSGELRVSRTVEGPCATGFRPDDDNASACIGVMPWRCTTDSDCPARTACDHTAGGVCVSGCRLDTDCTGEEVCDCRGRCTDPNADTTMSLRRPVIRLEPDVLSFMDDDNTTDSAQRVFVSVTNPNGVDQQTVDVVATAGVMISCDRWQLNSGVPEYSTFSQACTLTFAVDQTHNQALWVLPYGPQGSAAAADGRVFVRHDDGRTVAESSLGVSINTPPEPTATAPSGWYSGTLTLVGMGIAEVGDASSFASVAAQPPPWPLDTPVTVWRQDNAPDDVRLYVFDESQTLTASGWIGLTYTDMAEPPAIYGAPSWYSNQSKHSSESAAAAAVALEGEVSSILSFDDNTSLVWDGTSEVLLATFGFRLQGDAPSVPEAASVWRLDLRPEPNRLTPPTIASSPNGIPTSTIADPWIQRAAVVFSPLHFATDLGWQDVSTSNDVVNCVHSPRAFVGTTSTILERCRDTVLGSYGLYKANPEDPEPCVALVSALVDANDEIDESFFHDRYEICCNANYDGYQTYVCRCDEDDIASKAFATGTVPCRSGDSGGASLSACPIEHESVSPQIHIQGGTSGEKTDRYLLASTCAVRIANLTSFDAWSDAASASDVLASYYGGLDPDLVDPFSGDLLAWQHPAYTESTAITSYWFQARSNSTEPAYELPSRATSLPFFGADPGLGQHEMAAVCLGDLMRQVPDDALP